MYDEFRANEVGKVLRKIRELVDNERIHEKEAGQPGRPPCKRRDIIKCPLLIEFMNCVAQKSWSLLNIFKDILGLEKVPRPRTFYQYRAEPGITATLQRLQKTVARDLWMKERTAAIDPPETRWPRERCGGLIGPIRRSIASMTTRTT